MQGQQRTVQLHRQVFTAAERAADTGQVDADLLRLQVEAGRDLVAVDVQPLRGDVDVDAALSVRHREPRLRAEERLILDPDLVDTGDGHVAFRLGIAVPDHERAHDVRTRIVPIAVAHRRPVRMERVLLGRPLGIDHRLELLVLDPDAGCRSARLLRMLGSNECDGLAEVAHALVGEHGLIGELEAVAFLARHVLVRQHRVDAGHADRLRDVDRDDARVRVRAPQRVAPQHPGRLEIARVGELARDLRNAVDPRRAVADAAELEPR